MQFEKPTQMLSLNLLVITDLFPIRTDMLMTISSIDLIFNSELAYILERNLSAHKPVLVRHILDVPVQTHKPVVQWSVVAGCSGM